MSMQEESVLGSWPNVHAGGVCPWTQPVLPQVLPHDSTPGSHRPDFCHCELVCIS